VSHAVLRLRDMTTIVMPSPAKRYSRSGTVRRVSRAVSALRGATTNRENATTTISLLSLRERVPADRITARHVHRRPYCCCCCGSGDALASQPWGYGHGEPGTGNGRQRSGHDGRTDEILLGFFFFIFNLSYPILLLLLLLVLLQRDIIALAIGATRRGLRTLYEGRLLFCVIRVIASMRARTREHHHHGPPRNTPIAFALRFTPPVSS